MAHPFTKATGVRAGDSDVIDRSRLDSGYAFFVSTMLEASFCALPHYAEPLFDGTKSLVRASSEQRKSLNTRFGHFLWLRVVMEVRTVIVLEAEHSMQLQQSTQS